MPTPPNPYVLERPYPKITFDDHTRRLSIRVLSRDWSIFANLYPQNAAVEIILTTLIHGIANELRESGLNSWSSENQLAFVAHIRRCATLRLARDPVPRDDSGTGESAGGTATQLAEEPSTALLEDDGGDDRQTRGDEGEYPQGESRQPFS